MADFTMTLQEVLEDYDDIGLTQYPIFDEQYREPLNAKIIDRFLFREIGLETPEMFIHCLRRKMNEIMPEYNQFYLSERLKIDPFKTLDMRTLSNTEQSASSEQEQEQETASTADGKTQTENVSDSKSRAVNSSTPQQRLNDFGDYADSIADSTGETSNVGTGEEHSENTSTGKNTGRSEDSAESSTENTQTGYSGSPAELLSLYRQTFLNIDLDILNRLDREGLFMNIWSSNDEYYRRENRYGLTRATYPFHPYF